jgi:hypothetical protein
MFVSSLPVIFLQSRDQPAESYADHVVCHLHSFIVFHVLCHCGHDLCVIESRGERQ